MTRYLALISVTATCAALLTGVAATSASAAAACGTGAPDLDHSVYVASTTNVIMHSGSNINCTNVAQLSQGQRADYYCYTINSTSGLTWTYLRDVATGKLGWVRDDYLPNDGSSVYCGH